jgi:hypothetical protein
LLGDANDGKHTLIDMLAQTTAPGTLDTGDGMLFAQADSAGVTQLYYIDSNNVTIQLTSNGAIDTGGSVIPSGTVMCFLQAAVPTGWVQDTGANDAVIRLVSGTGGGYGGSWTISGATVGSTTLTAAQIPSHTHPFTVTFAELGSGGDPSPVYAPGSGSNFNGTTGDNSGGDGSHTHSFTNDGSWRPVYVDAVIGVKS